MAGSICRQLTRGIEQKPCCRRCLADHNECAYGVQLSWPDERPRIGNRAASSRGSERSKMDVIQHITVDARDLLAIPSSDRHDYTTLSWLPFVNTTSTDFAHSFRHEDVVLGSSITSASNEFDSHYHVDDETLELETVQSDFALSLFRQPSQAFPAQVDSSPFARQLFDFCKSSLCVAQLQDSL